jgi:hypothetical protein
MKTKNVTISLMLFIISAFFSLNVYSANFYWVGGAGNWNDSQHWSSTSGGSGGYGVPSLTDNAYFDANSGFTASSNTVTVNVATASCKDMDWCAKFSCFCNIKQQQYFKY